ncbi:cell division suppressor protein YneA [Bacillus sp. FSL K6-3431]|uniref:cell division suppressor protein YneA n=1 Tax=Bacillus sp. FSL K6-3431 TaxID=2921500 RepID=UPI0030FB3FC9
MNYIWKKYSFAIILFILTFVMGIYVIFSSNSNTNEYVIITVQDGESLWSISERYAHNLGVTTSEFVNMLEEKNELKHKLIKSGEQLKVPTPNEKLDNLDNHERQFVIQTE